MSDTEDHPSLTILVIDDSITIRRSADLFLRQAGHQVMLATDGLDALAALATMATVGDGLPDLIFCDIVMPGLDGYRVCALLKKNARFHATQIIMLSSKDGLFDRARA